MRESFADVLVGALANVTGRLLDVLPRLAALGIFVGLGGIGAWALVGLAQAGLRAASFDRAAAHWGLWRVLQAGGSRRSPTDVLAGALGTGFFALATLLALDAIEVPGVGSITAVVVNLLPRAVGGVLFVVLGVLGSRLGAFGARLAWSRYGWRRSDLAARATAWAVRGVAFGFALTVVGVPPQALLIATAVPLAVIGLGAALGVAQVVHAASRRAAERWFPSLAAAARPVPSHAAARAEGPAAAPLDIPEPVGAGAEGFARFHPSEE